MPELGETEVTATTPATQIPIIATNRLIPLPGKGGGRGS